MVVNKRKKNSRARGTWTHGWGEKKKHRHAGSRGGRGMAGTGKRADQKKPSIITDPQYFGKFGFSPISRVEHVIVNVGEICSQIDQFVADGVAKKEGKMYVLDFTKTPYTKLLGAGKVTLPLQITIAFAAKSAKDKVESAGGSVKVPETILCKLG